MNFKYTTASQVRAFKLIRILRLVRLLKLARLLKLGKFIHSVEEILGLSPAAFKLMKLVFNVTFIAHLLACFWYYVSTVEEIEERDNWCVHIVFVHPLKFFIYYIKILITFFGSLFFDYYFFV